MPQPFAGPASLTDVKLRLPGTDATDDALLTDIIAAVNALVRALPSARATTRTVSVTTIIGTTGLTATAGTFLPTDVSAVVTGTGIPAGATLAAVPSSSSATLSAAATASGTVSVVLEDNAWAPNVELGANMLAARLWRRRDSADGVSDMAAQGPIYVERNDPDVALLLKIGAYAAPRVG